MNHFVNYFFSIGVDAIIARLIITRFTKDQWLPLINALSILWYLILNVPMYPDVAVYSISAGLVVFGLFILFDHTLYRKLSFSLPYIPLGKGAKTKETSQAEIAVAPKNHPQRSQFSLHMPQFVKNYLRKQEGKKQYKEMLANFLSDNKLDDTEKKKLEALAKEYDLTDHDLTGIQKDAFYSLFDAVSKNERITDEGNNEINALVHYFNIDPKEDSQLQEKYNRYRMLDMLDHGQLPTVKDVPGLKVILKEGEVVHCVINAALMKYKHVTQRINYGGFSSSIRIMKGLRYRAGSYRVSSQSKEFLVAEDTGNFWITNQRIGFQGQRKDFDIKYDKILSFNLTDAGLMLAKQGRENPYIIRLGYYEIPVRILSMILNKD